MTAWYYSDTQRNRLGPVAAADLAELHRHGQLQPGTLVWREGLGAWAPWHEVMDEVLGPRTPVATPAPALAIAATTAADDRRPLFEVPNDEPALAVASGYNPYHVVDRVPVSSPYAAPHAALGGAAMAVMGGEVVYAGFWKRVAAYLIDFFIVMVSGAVIGGILGVLGAIGGSRGAAVTGIVQLITSLAGLAYFIGFHSSSLQATPGKLAIGIKVSRSDGERIGVGRSVGRYFATILSSLVLLIGYLMAGFTDRKQALHDMVCDTVVVDKWAFTAYPQRQRLELGAVTVLVIVLGLGLLVLGIVAFAGMAAAIANAGR